MGDPSSICSQYYAGVRVSDLHLISSHRENIEDYRNTIGHKENSRRNWSEIDLSIFSRTYANWKDLSSQNTSLATLPAFYQLLNQNITLIKGSAFLDPVCSDNIGMSNLRP